MSLNNLTREELIKLVTSIFESPEVTEEEGSKLMYIFIQSVPHPEPLEFFTNPKYNDYTYEQKVDLALSYTPIQLPASSS
jgi:hypothetical protein